MSEQTLWSVFAIYIVLPLTSVPSNPPGCVPACSIKVRGSHGLLECMEQYVVSECKPGATLAVMGSVELTSNVFESAVVSLFHLLSHGRASRALVMWLDFPPSIWSNPHLISPFSSPRCLPPIEPLVYPMTTSTIRTMDDVQGSVTLGFMRRTVGLPVLVVTQVSINSPVGLSP